MDPLDRRLVASSPAARRSPVWHHVIQRGPAKRPVFSERPDVRALEELLDQSARHRALEVHAFTVLTTHCHLLVKCPRERLTGALRGVFGPLARRINRRLRREGALFGRSCIKPVMSTGHWRAVVAYIDQNAVEAGLADRPSRYPFASAWHSARPSGPPWLCRDVVERFVCRRTGTSHYDPSTYSGVFGDRRGLVASIARRRISAPLQLDPLDDLLASAPEGVQRWLERRALLVDGARTGPVLVAPEAILAAIAQARDRWGKWSPGARRRPGPRVDGWRVLAAGLLRASSGLGLAEIGETLGLSTPGAHQHVHRHLKRMSDDVVYASRSRDALTLALERTYGGSTERVVDQ